MNIIRAHFEQEYEFINPKIFGFSQMENYRKVVAACDALIFHPFEDKIIPAGVKSEVELAFGMGKDVFWLDPDGKIKPFTPDPIYDIWCGWKVLDVVATRKMMRALVQIGKYPRPPWWIKKEE